MSRSPNSPAAERVSASSLAKALLEMKALRFGDFTLPNGKPSPYDIDLRLVPSFPEIYTTVLAAYVELTEKVGEKAFEAIAGVATAGVTVSAPLAVMLKKPMMYVRKQGEGKRQGRLVEGVTVRGSRVIIIDDLVSTGSSIVAAAGALRDEGYVVTDTAVLVDRQEGGREALAKAGVRLNSFTTVTKLLEAIVDGNMAERNQAEPTLRKIRG